MSNYIRKSNDNHTRALDAICLAECVWWGTGQDLYQKWEHGIYEFRDLCWRLSNYTHHAWEHVREVCGESSWEFDTEFCPELVYHTLNNPAVHANPYIDADILVRHFVDTIIEEHFEMEAAEKKRKLIEAQILDRQEEIFLLQEDLERLKK
jgi:hypothetical protein